MYTAIQVSDWFLHRNQAEINQSCEMEDMTHMKLHKLLYYAQGVSLAVNNEPLFEDKILHWEHGPVVYELFDKYRGQREIDAESLPQESYDNFVLINKNEKATRILEAVYDTFGRMSAWTLRERTHNEDPWMLTARDAVIDEDLIKNYFLREIIA